VVWTSDNDCLTRATFAGVYRADARGLTTRPVFQLHLKMMAAVPTGVYWLEWSARGVRGSGVWAPAIAGVSPTGGAANAMQSVGAVWAPIGETPIGSPHLTPQGLPMIVRGWVQGSSPTCYTNCDGSTMTPFLSVVDFTCFLRRYSLESPYANCDGSQTAPVLNIADMQCFLAAFANGCSAP
jgi:hypothetical protein